MYPKGGRNSCVSCQIHILLTSRAYPYYGPRIFCTEEGFNFRSRHKIKLVGGFQGFLVYSNYSGCRRSGGGGSEANGPHLRRRLPQNLYLKLSGGRSQGESSELLLLPPPVRNREGKTAAKRNLQYRGNTALHLFYIQERGFLPGFSPSLQPTSFQGTVQNQFANQLTP